VKVTSPPGFISSKASLAGSIQILENVKAENTNSQDWGLPRPDSAEAIPGRPIEIAAHLSGARNDKKRKCSQ